MDTPVSQYGYPAAITIVFSILGPMGIGIAARIAVTRMLFVTPDGVYMSSAFMHAESAWNESARKLRRVHREFAAPGIVAGLHLAHTSIAAPRVGRLVVRCTLVGATA